MKPETAKAISNMASIAELVAEARAAAQPNVAIGRPEGGITTREYAELVEIGQSAAKRDLEKLVARGEYEIISAIAPTTAGNKVVKQQFYRKVSNAMDRIR